MTGKLGKTTSFQDDIIGAKTLDERNAQWGEIPGKIVSFDPATQTATVQPLYKPKFNGTPVDMPELLEVPVRFSRAGGGAITFPVGAGDKVTLRPQMRSSENYLVDDEGSASDGRSFNLSDMEAFLDGGETLGEAMPNFDSQNMHLRSNPDGSFGIKASPDGKFRIDGSEGNVYDLNTSGLELAAEGFTLLGTEGLDHSPRYAEIGDELYEIVSKLRAMQL
ncbi:baseplate assembly protein V [Rhizobium phage RHph_Y17]|uniref:Baseplate assembly protein V n=2 Tax=Kleczkowskavirus RHEph4 TaxID=1921526 RepID=A0A7S5USW5_9CAUD|nr:baseplate assembly protein V [Rhizobium phage RHph_Y17]QIG68975.1 baseplate assembly protein V [Rhizobium phage RHph_Y3_43]